MIINTKKFKKCIALSTCINEPNFQELKNVKLCAFYSYGLYYCYLLFTCIIYIVTSDKRRCLFFIYLFFN